MSINDKVGKFIQKQGLLSTNAKVLVAVSGGVDSMVLLAVLTQLDFEIGVASVNYRLRKESDAEIELVKNYCIQKELPFYSYTSSKSEQESLKSGNLQDKARKIRYAFFDSIKEDHGYNYLLTGHHQDDSVEGFFLGLLRGAGLAGLTSLISKASTLRPLISCSKDDIINYAKKYDVPFMHDRSNYQNEYDRNYIRNEVIPVIEKRFLGGTSSIVKSISHLADTNKLLNYLCEKEIANYISYDDPYVRINRFSEIRNLPGNTTFLHLAIKDYGFTSSQIEDILETNTIGAMFHTDTHEALFDRDCLVLRKKVSLELETLILDGVGTYEIGKNEMIKVDIGYEKEVSHAENVGHFCREKIKFPLVIRKWKFGDRFYPLGMKGKSKKVQDLLTDLKLSRFEKENVRVVCSDKQIIWVINHRIDERFKITEASKEIVRVQFVYK